MRIAVVGAGAIGGVVGGLLDRAGFDVHLVDTNADHVAAINQDGLHIDGDQQTERIRVRAVTSPADLPGPVDLVFLCVKSTVTVPAVRSVLPYLTPDGVVVSLQNGMGNEDAIADVVGSDRMLSGVVGWGATFSGPGHITRTSSEGGFEIGEWNGGLTRRARDLAEILDKVAPTVAMDNVRGAKWTKLIVNATINSLGALVGRRLGEMVKDPRTRVLMLKLITEGVRVARADGVKLEKVNGKLDMRLLELATPDEFQALRDASTAEKVAFITKYKATLAVKTAILQRMAKVHGHIKSSMWQDLERGLRTEIDYLNGYVVERGRALGIPTPCNAMLVNLIKEIERGERQVDYRNTYLLETAEFELPEPRKLEETSRTAAFFLVSLTRTFAEDLGWSHAQELVEEGWRAYAKYYGARSLPPPALDGAVNQLDRAARQWQALWFDRHASMRAEVTAAPGEVAWSSEQPCQYWNVATSLGLAEHFAWPMCKMAAAATMEAVSPDRSLTLKVVQRGCQGDAGCKFVLHQQDGPDVLADPASWDAPDEHQKLLLSSNTAGFFFAELTRLAAREMGWERANAALERFWQNLGTTFTKQVLAMFQVKERDATAAWRTLIFLLFNRHPDMVPSMLEVLPERVVAQNLGGCRYWEMSTSLGVLGDIKFPACLPLLEHLAETVNPDLRFEMVKRQCEGDGCCELHFTDAAKASDQGHAGLGRLKRLRVALPIWSGAAAPEQAPRPAERPVPVDSAASPPTRGGVIPVAEPDRNGTGEKAMESAR